MVALYALKDCFAKVRNLMVQTSNYVGICFFFHILLVTLPRASSAYEISLDLFVQMFAKSVYFSCILWIFNIFVLIWNRIYEGYSFSIFGLVTLLNWSWIPSSISQKRKKKRKKERKTHSICLPLGCRVQHSITWF